jgi:NAD(P)-dependent dehydrogenase (short-subunit alcohol dehydrogenase family)
MKLTGRTILITGGTAGIGLAFALKFLELGNQIRPISSHSCDASPLISSTAGASTCRK